MNEFSNRLKTLREEKNLTQSDLANLLQSKYKIKTSVQNISYWEKGREPNFNTVIALASIFNVTTDFLLGNSNIKNNSEHILFDNSLPRQLIDIFNKIEKNYFYIENNIQSDGYNAHFNQTYMDIICLINKFFYEFETSLINFSKISINSFIPTTNPELIQFLSTDPSTVVRNKITNDLDNLTPYIPKIISLIQELLISYSLFISKKTINTLTESK